MNNNFFLEEILGYLGSNAPEFNILEQTVDINLQAEYFEFVSKQKNLKTKDFDGDIEKLYSSETSIDDKRLILTQLASTDSVKSYRAIEKFVKTAEPEIRDWAVLALHESRMIVESSLTNDRRVFISTGMGGQGNKLRYFCVFVNNNEGFLSEFHQKLFQKELEFTLKKNQAVIEEVNFFASFISLVVLIPLTIPVQKVLKTVIDDCNQFGNFLADDLIISNVKKLNEEEIRDFIDNRFYGDADDIDDSNPETDFYELGSHDSE